MTTHDVTFGWARNRKVNGVYVSSAVIVEENAVYQSVITDCRGQEFVSGSNSKTLTDELMVMKAMFDPIR